MSNEVMEHATNIDAKVLENVLLGGNLAELSPEQRVNYYDSVCKSLGLNPLTKPFEFITLNGKLTLYARKDCTEQLRSNRKISLKIMSRENVGDVYIVTAQATLPDGRCDESIGAVNIANSNGDAMANAVMKAETKAKRRVTLSICGLGMLDETELETIPAGFGGKPVVSMPAQKPAIKTEAPQEAVIVPGTTVATPVVEQKPVASFNADSAKKSLAAIEKNIGTEAFKQLLADHKYSSVDDINTQERFDEFSLVAWKLRKQQKAVKDGNNAK